MKTSKGICIRLMNKEIFGSRILGKWKIWGEYDPLIHKKCKENLSRKEEEKLEPYIVNISFDDNASSYFKAARTKEEAYIIIEAACQMYALLKYGTIPKGGPVRDKSGSLISKKKLEEIHKEMIENPNKNIRRRIPNVKK